MRLLNWMATCVPMRKVKHRKSTHPWLTEEVLEKVAAKQKAEGTEEEKEAAEACSEAVRTAYKQYVHLY